MYKRVELSTGSSEEDETKETFQVDNQLLSWENYLS